MNHGHRGRLCFTAISSTSDANARLDQDRPARRAPPVAPAHAMPDERITRAPAGGPRRPWFRTVPRGIRGAPRVPRLRTRIAPARTVRPASTCPGGRTPPTPRQRGTPSTRDMATIRNHEPVDPRRASTADDMLAAGLDHARCDLGLERLLDIGLERSSKAPFRRPRAGWTAPPADVISCGGTSDFDEASTREGAL